MCEGGGEWAVGVCLTALNWALDFLGQRMKRYRVMNMEFDTRAAVLSTEIEPSWKPNVREQWEANRESLRESLRAEYGAWAFEQKEKNFIELGAAPFSLVAFHNEFFWQARRAFVIGAYYPSLTALCALGERVLNHLVLTFRGEFDSTSEYRKVYRKNSFDDWTLAIDALEAWRVLLPRAAERFRELKSLRNRSLHFNPETETNVREKALEASKLFCDIIQTQFAAFGPNPWFIPNRQGVSLVRKASENDPFVKKIVLPNCVYVGPSHSVLPSASGAAVISDADDYEEREISDEEYLELLASGPRAPATTMARSSE